jgi:hypothetical protein
MKKLHLTPLQLFRLHEAKRQAEAVLNEIKVHKLEGQALDDMKLIEGTVVNLECVLVKA